MGRDASGYGQLAERSQDSRPKFVLRVYWGGSPKVPYANGETLAAPGGPTAVDVRPRAKRLAAPWGLEHTGWHTTHAALQKPAAASLQTSKHAIAGPEPPKGRAANGA